MDAFFDLQYQVPAYSSYVTGNFGAYRYVKRIPAWDLWHDNSGFYWMLYNNAAPPSAPIVGAFTSHAAKILRDSITETEGAEDRLNSPRPQRPPRSRSPDRRSIANW